MKMAAKLKNINFDFGTAESNVLKRLNLEFLPGKLTLICGPTGSGKSTLLQLINRLVPTFSAGRLSGTILLDEKEITKFSPAQVSQYIGYVNQRPESFFVSETVLEELAFGMEQLGVNVEKMHERINRVAGLLDLGSILSESLSVLSAGQQQKVAIGAALAAGQKILLLDEPTSALDDEACDALLKTLRRLADAEGVTVIIAEHKFERLLTIADSLVVLKGDGSAVMAECSREALGVLLPTWLLPQDLNSSNSDRSTASGKDEIVCKVQNLSVRYPGAKDLAIDKVSFEVRANEILVIEGLNGSGKTSLLMAIAEQLTPATGTIKLKTDVAMVPQRAADLLFLSTVAKELAESDAVANAAANTTSSIFERLVGRVDPAIHPRDLSSGQQLALVLAVQIAQGAKTILLDEPTTGLDVDARASLAKQLIHLRNQGTAVVVATHDKDFASLIANRTIRLQSGELVQSMGPAS